MSLAQALRGAPRPCPVLPLLVWERALTSSAVTRLDPILATIVVGPLRREWKCRRCPVCSSRGGGGDLCQRPPPPMRQLAASLLLLSAAPAHHPTTPQFGKPRARAGRYGASPFPPSRQVPPEYGGSVVAAVVVGSLRRVATQWVVVGRDEEPAEGGPVIHDRRRATGTAAASITLCMTCAGGSRLPPAAGRRDVGRWAVGWRSGGAVGRRGTTQGRWEVGTRRCRSSEATGSLALGSVAGPRGTNTFRGQRVTRSARRQCRTTAPRPRRPRRPPA